MNENNAVQPELALTDDLVVEFLQDNPDFFSRHPELLTSIKLADSQRGVVSLVEKQQQLQRQKIHQLEDEITQLMTVANHNENLFAVYSDLYLVLMDCNSLEEILDNLTKAVTELLSLKNAQLWLSKPSELEHKSIISSDANDVFANRLSDEPFYFGRLQQQEQDVLFGEHQSGSVVLIKLEHMNENIGMLVISSEDAEHFDPRMDTLLLGQFRTMIAKLIAKFI